MGNIKSTKEFYKYPRTFHLPWSLGKSSDDKTLNNTHCFSGKEIVVTEKMDGENSTLYCDHFHARSLDGRSHPSRDWLKAFHATFADQIPKGWRICGENVYAQHSISYDQLESYFYAFSLWDRNICKSWDESVEWFELLGLNTVPVLYRGIYDENQLKKLAKELDPITQEGYVVRLASEFEYNLFDQSVAKFVRSNHVTTDKHWMNSEIVPNRLRKDLI